MTSESPRGGRFTRDKLETALAQVCSSVGLDPRGAELLRLTNNAIYRLTSAPVVVRIVASRALRYRVDKMASVAAWLAEHGVSVIRLLEGIEQPVVVEPHVATLWWYVPHTGQSPTGADLANLLRQIHQLEPPDFPLPRWEPLADVRRRLADAEELDARDREFLEQRCREVQQSLDELDFPLPPTLIHGDAHLGNLIPGPDGAVLCDFDSACFGPPEWDLTPLAVGLERFEHAPEHYAQLVAGYGFDVTRWSGFPVLREARELKLATSVLPILRSNPDVRTEFFHRLETFRRGDVSVKWNPYR